MPVLNKNILYKEYITKRKTIQEIADRVGCSYTYIRNGLLKYNIKIRKHTELFNGEDNPSYNENALYKQIKYCKCGRKITPYSDNCYSCANMLKYKKYPYLKKSGKNNPAYIDGRSYLPYPIEFNKDLKIKIKQRDNYTCQNCEMIEEEHIIVIGYGLTIHHIDYSKQNCEEDNLITLCNWCNLRANYNRDYWESYYKEKIKWPLYLPI